MRQAEVALGRGLGLSEPAPRVVQSEIRAMTQECDRLGGVNLAPTHE
jgi:aminotransferase